MAIVSRKILKSFFQKGAKPSQEHFSYLIDSFVHVVEDGSKLRMAEFNDSAAYEAGSLVIYNGAIYKAEVNPTQGAFNGTEWKKLTGGDIVEKDNKATQKSFNTIPEVKEEPRSSQYAGWRKVVVEHTMFQSPDAEIHIKVAELKPGEVLLGLMLKHTISFTGKKIKSYTLSFGTNELPGKFIADFDVRQSVSDEAFYESQFFNSGNWTKGTELLITAKSKGAALDNSADGKAELYLLVTSFGNLINS